MFFQVIFCFFLFFLYYMRYIQKYYTFQNTFQINNKFIIYTSYLNMSKIELNQSKENQKEFAKEKNSLKSFSDKLKTKKEDFEWKTLNNTNNSLQNMEESIKIQKEKNEINDLKRKVKKETNWFSSNKEQQKTSNPNFLEIWNAEWLTVTDFQDIFDDIADDREDIKNKFPTLTLKSIVQKIKQNRLLRQQKSSKNENQEWLSNKKENLTALEEREQAVSDIIFGSLKQWDKENWEQNLTENIEIIAYIINNFDKLDDEKKKKFMKWFKEIMAKYLEWKIIEVYEITIRDWQIVITWKWEDWKKITVKLNEKNIWKQAMQKIQNMIKDKTKKISLSSNKEIWDKKVWEKIEKWEKRKY